MLADSESMCDLPSGKGAVVPPEDESLTRRLSAVLHADVVDFSALMARNERDAMAAVRAVRELFERVVPQRGGMFKGKDGDAFVALFDSAVEGVQAAVDIQTELAEAADGQPGHPQIRIGIHLGEVVHTPSGLLGDAINVAARIQADTHPGCVGVSEDVFRAVRNRLSLAFRDLGLRRFKNIDALRIYELDPANLRVTQEAQAAHVEPPPTPGRVGRGPLSVGIGVGAIALVMLTVGYYWLHTPVEPGRTPAAAKGGIPATGGPVVLGVMQIQTRGNAPAWMSDTTRDGLNTVLSKLAEVGKFEQLRVFSKEKIDFLREKRGLKEIEAAEELGIQKMISGTIVENDSKVLLEVRIVDIATGFLESSDEVSGNESQLIEMQNQAAMHVAKSLRVTVKPEEATKILAARTNDQLDDYKLLAETMGGFDEGSPDPPKPSGTPPGAWNLLGPRAAYAEGTAADGAVRALLERYRQALESKDLEALAGIYVAMPDAMKDALGRYFQNADSLKVQFSNVDILVEGDEALATFTRTDDFKDARSGRDQHLEVRVSSVVAKQGTDWKIKGLKKPS